MNNGNTFISGTSLNEYTRRVFAWLTLGLLITAITAFVGLVSGITFALARIPFMALGLLIAELALVFKLSASLHKLSISTAKIMFLVYAVLTGLTFGVYGLIYEAYTIFYAFAYTSVLFGSMAFIGYTTKADLTKYSSLVFAGLIALIVATVLNMFIVSDTFTTVLSYVGIVLFMGITAYDLNKMKKLYEMNQGDEVALSKLAIYSALDLFLDFINIFIYILRIIGKKK